MGIKLQMLTETQKKTHSNYFEDLVALPFGSICEVRGMSYCEEILMYSFKEPIL